MGLFVLHEVDGAFRNDLASLSLQIGRVHFVYVLSDNRVIIKGEKDLFLAQERGGNIEYTPIDNANIGATSAVLLSVDRGVLVRAEQGFFFISETDGKVSILPASEADLSAIPEAISFAGGTLLPSQRTLYFRRGLGEELKPVFEAPNTPITSVIKLSDAFVLLGDRDRVYVLSRKLDDDGKFDATPLHRGQLFPLLKTTPAVLDFSADGLLIPRLQADGKIEFRKETASINRLARLSDNQMIVHSEDRWLRPSERDGHVELLPIAGGEKLGEIVRWTTLPSGKLVIQTGLDHDKQLVLASSVGKDLTISDIPVPKLAIVEKAVRFPDVGALINTSVGLFEARETDGGLNLSRIGTEAPGPIESVFRFRSGRMVIKLATSEIYLTVPAALSEARVEIQDRKSLDGGPIDETRRLLLVFSITHECAPSVKSLQLGVRITAPDDKPPGMLSNHVERVTEHAGAAELAISDIFHDPGRYTFQIVSRENGAELPVGGPTYLSFKDASSFEQRWKAIAIGAAILLAVLNVLLFAFSRRSAWAWRVATDDSWSTWGIRVVTLALSHVKWAQLWILDLYFHRLRRKSRESHLYLHLPLTIQDGEPVEDTKALATPWTGKRLWVQGASGMGKTTIFRHFTQKHFQDCRTVFSANSAWGCVLVAFAARDFASAGEDTDDPAWVLNAVRASLSGEGVTFSSETMLSRFLENGAIGVAIDGLNEVERTKAVNAFSRRFEKAPMFVTSQELGPDRFRTWRLPFNVSAFRNDLLQLYLPAEDAKIVINRIAESALNEAIKSGYDVRLLIDLVRTDPAGAKLPIDRMDLYAAVIEAGWPAVSEELKREQQNATAAAAWRMVSERKPNEDMRRLKPDVDLPKNILEGLADAPKNDNRSVRLVRRVGAGAFEFVHDQMHAYLAARWFAKDGIAVSELEKMVAGSKIWAQTLDARRTLWSFVTAMLDDERLIELWKRVAKNEDWDLLERILATEGEQRGILEPRKPRRRQ